MGPDYSVPANPHKHALARPAAVRCRLPHSLQIHLTCPPRALRIERPAWTWPDGKAGPAWWHRKTASVILLLLLVATVLLAVFWGTASLLQAYFYSESTPGLSWRAPSAAGMITLFLGLWCYLDYRAFSRGESAFDAPFYVAGIETRAFPEFQAANAGPDGRLEQPTTFVFKNGLFVQDGPRARPWSPTDLVIVKENGQDVRFDAERDARGNYVRHRKRPPPGLGWLTGSGAEQPLRYTDPRGRVMTEDLIGRLTTPRWGMFWSNLLLNLAHLMVWFLALWLLLRFQWAHALGVAFVLWMVMTVVFIHMLVMGVEARAVRSEQTAATETRFGIHRMCMMSPSRTT